MFDNIKEEHLNIFKKILSEHPEGKSHVQEYMGKLKKFTNRSINAILKEAQKESKGENKNIVRYTSYVKDTSPYEEFVKKWLDTGSNEQVFLNKEMEEMMR